MLLNIYLIEMRVYYLAILLLMKYKKLTLTTEIGRIGRVFHLYNN